MPRSCLFDEPVKLLEARVSSAVVPPSAMSHAVDMANMYEKAAVARASGESRPTMRTETVWSEFCSVYASMTGMDALVRSHISASHDLHSRRPGLVDSPTEASEDDGFGRRAEVSEGRLPSGVTVLEEEPLGMSLWISEDVQACIGGFELQSKNNPTIRYD